MAILDESNGDISCPLTEFLSCLGKQYAGSVSGMVDLFRRFATSGRDTFNDELCHYVDKDEKIWEFVKGDLRVLWFYGTGGKIVVCSHGFVKKTRKVPPKEVSRAITAKQNYETAISKNQVQIIEDEDNGN